MGYLKDYFEFDIRDFDLRPVAAEAFPGAFATALDENLRAKHAAIHQTPNVRPAHRNRIVFGAGAIGVVIEIETRIKHTPRAQLEMKPLLYDLSDLLLLHPYRIIYTAL